MLWPFRNVVVFVLKYSPFSLFTDSDANQHTTRYWESAMP